jgi:hypothetical protein
MTGHNLLDEIKALDAEKDAIWQEVLDACVQAWPEQKKVFYNDSPTELIIRIINERDGEREAREKCEAALRAKDAAMQVLFDRLSRAGVDCSDLTS